MTSDVMTTCTDRDAADDLERRVKALMATGHWAEARELLDDSGRVVGFVDKARWLFICEMRLGNLQEAQSTLDDHVRWMLDRGLGRDVVEALLTLSDLHRLTWAEHLDQFESHDTYARLVIGMTDDPVTTARVALRLAITAADAGDAVAARHQVRLAGAGLDRELAREKNAQRRARAKDLFASIFRPASKRLTHVDR